MIFNNPGLGAILAIAVAVVALVLLIIGHITPIAAGMFIALAVARLT